MELGHVATTLETIAAAAEIAAARAELQPSLDERQFAALRVAASALKKPRAAAAGTRWDEAEDVRLCREFDSGMSVMEMATVHGRSKAAITLRLVKLGRIDASTANVRDRSAPLL
jgi:hypothetical protein